MEPLPSFDALAGPLEPPVREPAMRAAFERLRAEGRLLDRLPELALAEDFRWRAYRAVVLGHQGSAEDLRSVALPLAEDPHGFVRACCAWALGQPAAPREPELDAALLTRVKVDPVWAVGRRAALALGKRLPQDRLRALWSEVRGLPLLPWVRRGFVEALDPAAWPDAEVVAWLAEAPPEDAEALLWNLRPERWKGLALPPAVSARLETDPWLRDQKARFDIV